ncbi:MAG: hypothetical protein ACRDDY_10270 [Clostridium sp.]|uniref:hypothetical protein n=1 Tax=Clostridium sp. TaxID=1506 RepID=UPI003EE698F6
MKEIQKKRFMKNIVILGLIILAVPSVFFVKFKEIKIKRLKEEIEEAMDKEEWNTVIKLYDEIVKDGANKKFEKDRDGVKLYLEGKESFEKGKVQEAEYILSRINKAILSKELRVRVELLQNEVLRKEKVEDLMFKIKEETVKKEYIKADNLMKELKNEELTEKEKEEVVKSELKLQVEHKEYKKKIKEEFLNQAKELEKEKKGYSEWNLMMKEVLNELQRNLEDERVNILRDEHSIWKINESKINKENEKLDNIKKYVYYLIEKF